jgi:hypothetical protein
MIYLMIPHSQTGMYISLIFRSHHDHQLYIKIVGVRDGYKVSNSHYYYLKNTQDRTALSEHLVYLLNEMKLPRAPLYKRILDNMFYWLLGV